MFFHSAVRDASTSPPTSTSPPATAIGEIVCISD